MGTQNKVGKITDSTDGLRIPFGFDENQGHSNVFYSIAGKNQLAFDGIVIGTMNSGKTNFLNVLITSAAKFYSPAELNIYLLDYKIGVTSKMYDEARLPHIKQLIMTQSPEDGCAVLKAIKREIDRRSEKFEEADCEKIEDYNRSSKGEKLPRLLVIIDEAHILFNSNREACELMLDMITTARSFGVHFLFSTQSLANFKDNNEQMQDIIRYLYIRIAFSCRDGEAERFFGDSFDPKTYERPEKSGVGYITNNYADYHCTPQRFICAYESNEERAESLKEISETYFRMYPDLKYDAKVYRSDHCPKMKDIPNGETKDDCIHIGTCVGEENDVCIKIGKRSTNTLIYTFGDQHKRDDMLLLYAHCIRTRLNRESAILYYNADADTVLDFQVIAQILEYTNFQKLVSQLEEELKRRIELSTDHRANMQKNIFVMIRDIDYLLYHPDFLNTKVKNSFYTLVECGFLYGIRFVVSACTSKMRAEIMLLRHFPEVIAADMSTAKAAALFHSDQAHRFPILRNKEMWYSNLDISDEVKKIIPYLPERKNV